jgi:hypothetical protein
MEYLSAYMACLYQAKNGIRIGVDIGAIVVEQIALNLGLARLIQKI